MANLLDLLFPKKCVACKKIGSYLCDDCFSYLSFETKSICLVCNRSSFDGLTHPGCKNPSTSLRTSPFLIDGLFSSIPYNRTAQKLIYNFKYKPYLKDLKKALSDLFYEGLIQNENFMRQVANGAWLVVPIPLHRSKIKKRGYNQSEILSQEIAKRFNLPIQNLLTRVKNTKAQFGLDRKKRKENIQDAFLLDSRFKIHDVSIFLVDDVATTGSTLCEAAKVLKRNGAKRVIGLTLARD
jgi:competence protein ComFC